MAFDQQNDFLGKGWSFPPTFNRTLRSLEMTEKTEDIEKSLQILLTTAIGERIMQPRYGCNMEDLVFESLDTGTRTIITDKIKTAILFFEPRIKVEKIELNDSKGQEGEITVHVEYSVPSTNSRYNFVFPFYRNEGTELNLLTGNHPLGN
ncbi:MAG TPA: GPW/gp25 family protein [Ferruginibacter sp.]|nr:GPW/gp25 family protein [Ferruginibacter sp.]HPH91693.1 GPW/gp25 family protein [Ferruginibacter sp.]